MKGTKIMAFKLKGIHVPHNKNTANSSPVRMTDIKTVTLPTVMHIGAPAVPVVKSGDKVYLRNVTMNNSGEKANQTYMWLYDASFAKLEGRYKLFSQFSAEAMNSQKSQGRIDFDGNGNLTMLTIDHNVFYTGTSLGDLSNAAYLRISCEEIDGSSIITVNEPIV